MGRREGLPRRRPHPRSVGRTVPRRDQGEIPQVVRELPIPLHERFSSPGTRVYDLQDRVWCGLPEAVGSCRAKWRCSPMDSIVPVCQSRFALAYTLAYASSLIICVAYLRAQAAADKIVREMEMFGENLKVSARKKTSRQLPLS